jgi:hypothetical protein
LLFLTSHNKEFICLISTKSSYDVKSQLWPVLSL